MIKLSSIKTLALAVLAVLLTTGTFQSTVYIYAFIPSVPIVQNQTGSLNISVGYNRNPNGWSGTLNWGDGTSESAGGFYPPTYFNHTYANVGNYTI